MSTLMTPPGRGALYDSVTMLNGLLWGSWLLLAFQLATSRDYNVVERLVIFIDRDSCYSFEGVLARDKLAKHSVLCVYMRTWGQSYEEPVCCDQHINFIKSNCSNLLAGVGVLDASVGHAHQCLLVDFSPTNVLILEFSTIYGCSARAITLCDITSLNHKLVDNAVEGRHFIREAVSRACTYRPEAGRIR